MNEIRFNLDDIISGELIEDILVSLRIVHNKTPIQKIHFWHNGTNEKTIKDFQDRFDIIFENSTKVFITKRTPANAFVWFDIISDEVNKTIDCSNRFSYIYPITKKPDMLLGIHRFYEMYNYIETHPKSRRILYDKTKEDCR
jgi:hypothetical protein